VKSQISNLKSQIVVVGAGPAGSSLAIRLAKNGYSVTLIEKDRFPREKLCGEFISPECFRHFEELGVKAEMLETGADRITETRFFSKGGRSVAVPTGWFGQEDFALSLSRARMDMEILYAAKAAGVRVIEGARATGAEVQNGLIRSLKLKADTGEKLEIDGNVFVDASGRNAALAKLAEPKGESQRINNGLVGFKSHLTGVSAEPGVCEIYFFDGGYGGLSHVEDGKANFCFLVKAGLARKFIGKTNKLFYWILSQNARANERMASAEPIHDWLAVAVDGFGRKRPPHADNLYTVGDAGAFIDPFTGSGMLMAMESSELLARSLEIGEERSRYYVAHERLFRKRLRVSSVLRRAAFLPNAASAAIHLASVSDVFRSMLAKATRARGKSSPDVTV